MAPFENCRSSNFRETRSSSHLRVVDKVVDKALDLGVVDKGLDLGVEDEGLQLPAVSSVDKVRSWEVTMGDKVELVEHETPGATPDLLEAAPTLLSLVTEHLASLTLVQAGLRVAESVLALLPAGEGAFNTINTLLQVANLRMKKIRKVSGQKEVVTSHDSADKHEREVEEESDEEVDVAEELTDVKREEMEEEEEMEVLLELQARRGDVYTCPMVMSPVCDMDPIGLPEMMSGAGIAHLTSGHGLGEQEITDPRFHFAKWARPEGEAREERPGAEEACAEDSAPAALATKGPLRRALLRGQGQGSAGAAEVLSADTQDMTRMLRMVAAEAPSLEGVELAASCSAADLGAMLHQEVVEQAVSCGGTDMAAMLEGVEMGASCGGMQAMLEGVEMGASCGGMQAMLEGVEMGASCGGMQAMLEGVEMGASCSGADLNQLLGQAAKIEGVEMGASCGGADMDAMLSQAEGLEVAVEAGVELGASCTTADMNSLLSQIETMELR